MLEGVKEANYFIDHLNLFVQQKLMKNLKTF